MKSVVLNNFHSSTNNRTKKEEKETFNQTTNTSTMMEEIIRNSNNSRIESIKSYCRVCTSNPKTKRSHPEENIRIFARTGLKSILQKFLHLEISEDDALPKTICKKCFDKLMAIEYLQIVAKRSESLFKDFLANRAPKPIDKIQSSSKSDLIIKSAPTHMQKKPEEVIVDVSMSDPLTKDIKKKLQVAQSKRDSMGMAFSPDHISRNAVTSSPVNQVPVTIVHRMPKKRHLTSSVLESNQIVQVPIQKTNTTTVTLEHLPKKKLPPLRPKIDQTSPLRHISEAPTIPQNVEIHPVVTGNRQVMGHGLPLGSIIKDVDLLKLILKALKWPFNSQTLDIQIQRLKDTNFNDIIVDPNLLQDTDLIQILGPLIAPLPITMRQQTYHITIPPESLEIPPTTMSYKLPAETSVQIITVPAAEKDKDKEKEKEREREREREKEKEPSLRKHRLPKRHLKNYVPHKKSSFMPRPILNPQVIIVSDESEDDQLMHTASANEEIPNFGVQLDPAVYPGVGDNSNSNEAMLATLNRQREAMMRMHRSKRKQSLSCAKNVEMVDDIMIVDEGFHMDEPYPELSRVSKNKHTENVLPIASTSQRKTISATESLKTDLAFPSMACKTKTQPLPLSKPSTSSKPIKTLTENLKGEKVVPVHGFVKLKEDSSLPPLKRVKVLSKSSGYLQVKEPSKLVYMSKNTTLADADSTTKIVTKESKAPKTTKPPLAFQSKIAKAKRAAQLHRSESGGDQSSSNVKDQETEKNTKMDAMNEQVVVECQDESLEKQKKAPEEVVTKKKKYSKHVTAPLLENKKNDYKILATFDISDEEMESLQVEDTSEDPSVNEKSTNAVEKESPPKKPAECEVGEDKTAEELSPTENDPPVETIKESNSFEVPEIDIKAETSEEIQIKKENIESEEAKANQAEASVKGQRSFVASKTAIKSEILKSTRSSAKKKVTQKLKEEEPPIEITSFRPARRSKTLSKYYKGPPLSGTPGRSMRSRT